MEVEQLREMRKGILTAAQAAEILGVSVATLGKWRWTKRYRLPFVKIGRRPHYFADDLAAFLQRKREPGPEIQPRRRRQTRKAA